MHNKKILAKGLILGAVISTTLINSLANYDNEYNLLDTNNNLNSLNKDKIKKENIIEKSINELKNEKMINSKNTIVVNENIVEGSVLEISLTDGELVPDLSGNPNGYETIRVTTVGDKKLVKADYDNLRTSGIPKVDLSNAYSNSIPSGAFYKATHLTEFKFPQGITSIGSAGFDNGAFEGCKGLIGNLVIPDTVTSIGYSAFLDCSGFTGDLVIPDSVTTVESYAFSNCSGFNGSLMIGNSVTSIGMSAFLDCSGFTGDLVIPNAVITIGSYAFCGSIGFNGSLIIGNSVTTIGNYAFDLCIGLTGNLIIPDSVTSIGTGAFDRYSRIEKILIKVDSSNAGTNYKKIVIDNLPDTSQTVIDIPYDFDITGTWLEITSKAIAKPVIKNIIDGVESDLVDYKGEAVSLYIPSLYQESNVSVLKDGKPYTLPSKNTNNKHIFIEAGIYEVAVITHLGNTSVINFEVEDPRFKNAEEAVEKAEDSEDLIDINNARDLVNNLPECTIKDELQDRLNNIFPNLTLESKNATANLDVYIKSENMLLLSLDTNSVTFEDFSGVDDMESLNAVNLTVNSSLPYKINAYLATEIQNSDGTNIMDKDILNIRANGEADYNTFADTTTPIVLLDDQPADNNASHGIDLMLKGNIAHEKDIYKTVIKFEAEQK